jgi:hypothetical protein
MLNTESNLIIHFAAWHYFWLYATDKGRWPGHFYWADGSSLDKTTWGKGDPNAAAFGKATCVFLGVYQAKVFDDHCTHLRNILCEAPAALQSCVN